jgi:ATP-dependent RNA helicase RhlB
MEEKIPLLLGLIRQAAAERTMVFVNTRRQADRLEEVLRANKINAQALSGDVPQNKRLRYMKEFHSGELAVLIATDVASRGLHIPDVSHVFNYDLPQDCADYVHRIGRTARAGASGDAVGFACEEYSFSMIEIEQYIGFKIPVARITDDLLPVLTPPPRGEIRERAREHEQARTGGRGRPDARAGRGARGARPPQRTRHESRPSAPVPPAGVAAEAKPVAAPPRPNEAAAATPGPTPPAAGKPKPGKPHANIRRRKPETPVIG